MNRTARVALLFAVLAGCAATDANTTAPGRNDVRPGASCRGVPGKYADSDSYRPGAPDIAGDGEELLVTVVVHVNGNDGTCRVAEDALVEIWHTGDEGRYLDDAWRTARRTAEDGTTSYRTVRPTPEEDFPHLHVRVSTTGNQPEDWVIGVTPDTPRELHLALLVGTRTRTTPSVASTGESQV